METDMATVEFEEGVDEALGRHFAGDALRKVVDAYGDAEGLSEIDVSMSGSGVPVCFISPSRERRGEMLAVFLNEGNVLVGTGMDRDGLFRSFVFSPAIRTEATTCDEGFRRTACPWSEEAFLGCLKEALGRWTRPDFKGEHRRLVAILREAGRLGPDITFPDVGH